MAVELKPCPFCGERTIILFEPKVGVSNKYFVGCYGCHGSGGGSNIKEQAIGKWNRRRKKPDENSHQ
jgi:Lar family restriction alleviation protein